MKPAGEGRETTEEMKEAETEAEEKITREVEIKLLIMEYQKKTKPDPKTLKILNFFGGEVWREEKDRDEEMYSMFSSK